MWKKQEMAYMRPQFQKFSGGLVLIIFFSGAYTFKALINAMPVNIIIIKLLFISEERSH